MVDHSAMQLGKKPAKHLKGLPHFTRYTSELPAPPISVINSKYLPADLGMMLNDTLGDCTCAGIGHSIQVRTSAVNYKHMFTPSDDAILKAYEGACGFDPNNISTDQGGVETDVLSWWMKNPLEGHTLEAFASITPGNRNAIMDAIWLTGGVYIGLALPLTARKQTVWDVVADTPTWWESLWRRNASPSDPGTWGGHCVFVCDYDTRGLTCITWGVKKRMTWAFWDRYCDEAYALLCKDWVNAAGKSPHGFMWNQLVADMPSFA